MRSGLMVMVNLNLAGDYVIDDVREDVTIMYRVIILNLACVSRQEDNVKEHHGDLGGRIASRNREGFWIHINSKPCDPNSML